MQYPNSPRLTRSIQQLCCAALSAFWLVTNFTTAADVATPRPPSVVTTNRPVEAQARRTFAFAEDGVFVSNEFAGARLNKISRTGPLDYATLIAPENFPINDSAWFAFKVWSKSNQPISITLNYEQGKHRYHPKISSDGRTWKKIAKENFELSADRKSAVLKLNVGPEPLFVCGQELFTSADFEKWIREISGKKFVNSSVIGKSTLGKPIRKVEISEGGSDSKLLLIIGRQHPPELTGTFALRAFTETLCGDTPLAKKFRSEFKTIVIPLINPDGVDAGHWRHNANGVDLNRDWGQFHQQETRVARDEFIRIAKKSPGKVRFGLDFHSTQRDMLYPLYDKNPANTQLLDAWIEQIQSRTPGYKLHIDPSDARDGATTTVSTAWMNRQFGIPAVTYEVGDETDRELIRKVSVNAANALMELLLER